MARIRTFLAIATTADLQSAGEQRQRALSRFTDSTRWVAPADMHLTLKFLGEVDERQLPEICQVTDRVVKKHQAFSTPCRGLGAFPHVESPATVWLGVPDKDGRLAALQQNLETALLDLGFAAERRRFRAHITLGRLKKSSSDTTSVSDYLRQHENVELGNLMVDEVCLMRSELSRGGPEYTRLGHFSLA